MSLFILRRALNRALRFELVTRNVALMVDSPKLTKKEILPPSKEEVFKFLDAIKGHRLEAAFVLSVGLMLRRGEVLALRWSDISFENQSLTVNQQVNRQGGRFVDGRTSKLVFGEVKSVRSHRTLPMPQFVMAALEKQRDKSHGDLVFHTGRLTPIEPRRYDKEFKQVLKKASLPQEYRLHGLRHFGISLLAALNVHPRVAMEMAGHSDLTVTLRIYSHIASAEMREAAEKLQGVFGGL